MKYLYPQKKVSSYLTGFLILLAGGLFAQPRTIDTTFVDHGKVLTQTGPDWDEINSLVVQPDGNLMIDPAVGCSRLSSGLVMADGKVLIGGSVVLPGSGSADNFFAASINPDGSIDATFGNYQSGQVSG